MVQQPRWWVVHSLKLGLSLPPPHPTLRPLGSCNLQHCNKHTMVQFVHIIKSFKFVGINYNKKLISGCRAIKKQQQIISVSVRSSLFSVVTVSKNVQCS